MYICSKFLTCLLFKTWDCGLIINSEFRHLELSITGRIKNGQFTILAMLILAQLQYHT